MAKKTMKINLINEKIKESIDTIPQKIDEYVDKAIFNGLGLEYSFSEWKMKYDSPLSSAIKNLALPIARDMVDNFKTKLNKKQVDAVEKQIEETIADCVDDIVSFDIKDMIKDKVFDKIDKIVDVEINKKMKTIQNSIKHQMKEALNNEFEVSNPNFGESALEYCIMKNEVQKEIKARKRTNDE